MTWKVTALFASIVLATAPAGAMQQSNIPPKFNIPWGNSAGSSYIRAIPQASQIGTINGAASLTDGFPPLTFTPVGSGGTPPFGQDFNGILKQITQWNQWHAAGGPIFYDSTFSTSIGGYPKGSVLQSAVLQGRIWFSTADNNTTNPDATDGSSANWIPLPSTDPAGTIVAFPDNIVPPGTVAANGRTVGNASSNATNRANADTFWLFSFLWSRCGPCTLFNSGGGVISKGASPAADFAANNAIAVMNINGSGLMGADSMAGSSSSNLAGVPVISGSANAPQSLIGENLHTLSVGETPSHNHNVYLQDPGHVHGGVPAIFGAQANAPPGGLTVSGTTNTASAVTGITIGSVPGVANNNLTTSTGGGGAHNTVSRSLVVYWCHRL